MLPYILYQKYYRKTDLNPSAPPLLQGIETFEHNFITRKSGMNVAKNGQNKVIVSNVIRDSEAHSKGIKANDEIISINGMGETDIGRIQRLLDFVNPPIRIVFQRENSASHSVSSRNRIPELELKIQELENERQAILQRNQVYEGDEDALEKLATKDNCDYILRILQRTIEKIEQHKDNLRDEKVKQSVLREKILCSKCHVNRKNIVFLPCHHAMICFACFHLHSIHSCPSCQRRIQDTVDFKLL